MILFLDFDGVLHPFPLKPPDRPFSAIGHLWAILERLPEATVVITSTWRERHAFPALVAMLRAQGGEHFAERFVGTTPMLEDGREYVPGVRQREVEAWLEANASEGRKYLILDDIDSYFDADCAQLFLVNGATGLTQDDVESVVAKMNGRSF